MATLSKLLKVKIARQGLSLSAACKALDVSSPSLRAVLSDRSAPNSRSIGKYAKFLGVKPDAVIEASAPRGGKGRPGRPAAKPQGRRPGRGRPGRPMLPGVAKATIRLLLGGLASIQKRIDGMHRVIDKIRR